MNLKTDGSALPAQRLRARTHLHSSSYSGPMTNESPTSEPRASHIESHLGWSRSLIRVLHDQSFDERSVRFDLLEHIRVFGETMPLVFTGHVASKPTIDERSDDFIVPDVWLLPVFHAVEFSVNMNDIGRNLHEKLRVGTAKHSQALFHQLDRGMVTAHRLYLGNCLFLRSACFP